MKRYNSIIIIALFCSMLSSSICASEIQSKHKSKSMYMSYKGLIMAGYQGWFNSPNDGAERGWNHYKKGKDFKPGACTIDFWPDMTEYKRKYKTEFKLKNGKSAYVFSSYDKSTTMLHFKWMKEYNMDGVFMQRFVTTLRSAKGKAHTTTVLKNALKASQKYNRAISVMYDLSGMKPGEEELVIKDWKKLIDKYKLTSQKKNCYLYHNNKPLVAIWGVGFGGNRKYSYTEINKLIDFFKNDPEYGNCAILLGVPTYWRTLGKDTNKSPELHKVIKRADIVHPWFVGRYTNKNYPTFKQKVITDDMLWCKQEGLDYVPVVFPGFSWHNMQKNSKLNANPRLKGHFIWNQLKGAIGLGAEMIYVAMFDEIDEGTAVFKITNDIPTGDSPFVDNEGLPSDHYLWLLGEGKKLLHGERDNQFPTRK